MLAWILNACTQQRQTTGRAGLNVTNSNHGTTVGILYCGDMGSALGRLLSESGMRVITTCQGRSRATEEQARASGIEILSKLDDVVAQSDFVFSCVLPAAAFDVAQQYARCHQKSNSNSVFVEANAIGSDTLAQIERVMGEQDVSLVDAAIHGVARQLRDIGVLYVSGSRARAVAQICQGSLRVCWLGEQVGSASRMKLIMSGISKTLAAMFLEIGVLADRNDMLESFLDNCRYFYPGIMTAMERILPTYPRHAARRAIEIREIEKLAEASRLRLGINHEACELLKLVASVDWDRQHLGSSVDIRTIIRSVGAVCEPEN